MICHFNKAQYLPGEAVILTASGGEITDAVIYKLAQRVNAEISCCGSTVTVSGLSAGGYGIAVSCGNEKWEGAFDVVSSRRDVVRYGFLSDFAPEDADTTDVEWMRDLHINCIQFYDWMYRHDDLISPEDEYSDPMGRKTSLSTLKSKLTACSELGIRPFAYGAVYAATEETYLRHPEWAMYTSDGKPIRFADWLYYMNVSGECGWSSHLLEQYVKAVRFGFKGIHMDTYGFPKWVWDNKGRRLDLPAAFAGLVNAAQDAVEAEDASAGVIFNAVNNWPTEAIVNTDEDAVYVEVWPPNDSYRDLYSIISRIKAATDKSVILAAYMKPFASDDSEGAEHALRLIWAVISASGATQLVFGENRAVLCDSYYVRYAQLRSEFLPAAQKYCDYLVRYSALLYDDSGLDISRTAAGGINEDICFSAGDTVFSVDGSADSVWTVIREGNNRINIQLINLCGNDMLWNTAKKQPRQVDGIRISLRLDRELDGVWFASPDGDSLNAQRLDVQFTEGAQGRIYTVRVPGLSYWASVWVDFK